MVLENLIGQFLYSKAEQGGDSGAGAANAANGERKNDDYNKPTNETGVEQDSGAQACSADSWRVRSGTAVRLCNHHRLRKPGRPAGVHEPQHLFLQRRVDEAVFKPVATAYQNVTPRVARQGVTNFFDNLGDAWSFVNNVLQGQGQGAYNSMVRFSVNTVLGIGGLFDIASEAGIERRKQDFGQTLGRWGLPTGPYLVLPFWGPSTVRDSAGLAVDAFGYPANTMDDVRWRNSLFGLRMVNNRANLLKAGDVLDSVALDKYSLVRDVYLRSRIGGAASGGDGRLENYDDDNAGKLPPEGQ